VVSDGESVFVSSKNAKLNYYIYSESESWTV
jgi:hypothetical protein